MTTFEREEKKNRKAKKPSPFRKKRRTLRSRRQNQELIGEAVIHLLHDRPSIQRSRTSIVWDCAKLLIISAQIRDSRGSGILRYPACASLFGCIDMGVVDLFAGKMRRCSGTPIGKCNRETLLYGAAQVCDSASHSLSSRQQEGDAMSLKRATFKIASIGAWDGETPAALTRYLISPNSCAFEIIALMVRRSRFRIPASECLSRLNKPASG